MSLVQLTLIAPMAMRDDLVAAMLAHEPTAQAGFLARQVDGYGSHADYDSVVEQVHGHTLAIEIVLTAEEACARGLLDALGEEFAGRGVVWRMAAVPAAGVL
jgi:hypothetical protein